MILLEIGGWLFLIIFFSVALAFITRTHDRRAAVRVRDVQTDTSVSTLLKWRMKHWFTLEPKHFQSEHEYKRRWTTCLEAQRWIVCRSVAEGLSGGRWGVLKLRAARRYSPKCSCKYVWTRVLAPEDISVGPKTVSSYQLHVRCPAVFSFKNALGTLRYT